MEPFSVRDKISIGIKLNTGKRIGSYKLEGNKYVRLKLVYSSTSKIKVGIINKNRSREDFDYEKFHGTKFRNC